MRHPLISIRKGKNNSYLKSLLLTMLILHCLSMFSFILAQGESEDEIIYSRELISLDGYNLFSVHGISSFPAKERAAAISERIESIANNPQISPDSIKIVRSDDYDELDLNGVIIMRIFDTDAALDGVGRAAFSAGARLRIIRAIDAYRYERTYDTLLKKIIYSVAAIIVCLLLLITIRFLAKRVNVFLEAKLKVRFEKLETRSFQLIRSSQIWITLTGLIKTLKMILFVITIFATVQYVLGLFPWTRFISASLLNLFIKPFGEFGSALLNFIPDLAFLIVIFIIAKYVLKLVKLFFQGIGLGNITISGFDPEWAVITYKLARLFLIAFAVIVAYPYIPGSDSEAFKGMSLFLGILFSLGSTSVIGNLIAGYTMTYRKTFKIGDVVQIESNIGQVVEIKLFVTRIRTTKNEEVIIPNSIILNTNVINYSTHAAEKGLIIHTTVGIGYETPWRQVDGMLKLAAERTAGVLKDPVPFVLQKSLGDFAVTYELNGYILDPINRLKIYTELHQNILDVFNENDVQIMTPAYEGDPDKPKVVPKDQWFTPVAGIAKYKSEQANPNDGISN